MPKIARRRFLETIGLGAVSMAARRVSSGAVLTGPVEVPRPNIVFVFADQWRAQAAGYAGDPNARTPNLDRLARESVNFSHAVSACPVCSPYRACLMTGRYPLSHGVFLNDVPLLDKSPSIAQVFRGAGYDTGYIGKWHLLGSGSGYENRAAFIPPDRRLGFDFWRAMECTHEYNASDYYGDDEVKLRWEGYDAFAQTREARDYIRRHAGGKPFCLFLSWGPPHNPYQTAPQRYKELFKEEEIVLRANVPPANAAAARKDLAGYYAHIAALDDALGDLLGTLKEASLEEDTVFVFTSDHGDMLHSQGRRNKIVPYDESCRVPLLVRYPRAHGPAGRNVTLPVNTPDIMPTLLGLSGLTIPASVEGTDFSGIVRGGAARDDEAALLVVPVPFGSFPLRSGGKEYRGLRTTRWTYVEDARGPWLLFDNAADPYQLENLAPNPARAGLRAELAETLRKKRETVNDDFRPAGDILSRWRYFGRNEV
ncbi:MAG: sulfatase [Candidatus Aminicenantes bacterium]|nr:sulfatase [Candidatus Aminicenantes bacterium]